MKFGENLKNIRKMKRMSQEALAEKLGVSRQSVSKWETGEAYPEVNHILDLCKILHCKMNDLVHEDFTDIDSLGEKVKMKVVKFKKEQQKKMKGLSKTISILAKIGKIACILGVVAISLSMMLIPFLVSNIKVINNKQIDIFGEVINYERTDTMIHISYEGEEATISDVKEVEQLNHMIDLLENRSSFVQIGYLEVSFLFFIGALIGAAFALFHLEKLFENISVAETPFRLDNVEHMKKMAFYMIASIVVSNIGKVLFELFIVDDFGIHLELFDLVQILFLFSMAYIFEYGYQIQLDSKGVIYGE